VLLDDSTTARQQCKPKRAEEDRDRKPYPNQKLNQNRKEKREESTVLIFGVIVSSVTSSFRRVGLFPADLAAEVVLSGVWCEFEGEIDLLAFFGG
jgi:hypothetical protein